MRELLVFSPFNIIYGALSIWVMISGSGIKGFLMVYLLSLWEPCAGRFAPSMIEVKEHVIKMLVRITGNFHLVEMSRYVTHFIQVLRSYLTDVEIDHMTVICINLKHLIFRQSICINPVGYVHVLMREHYRWMSVVIPWCFFVVDLNVLITFVFVNLEKEVWLRFHLIESTWLQMLQLFTAKLLFEMEGVQFILQQFAYSTLDILEVFVIAILNCAYLVKNPFFLLRASQLWKPFSLSRFLVPLLLSINCGWMLLKGYPLLWIVGFFFFLFSSIYFILGLS